MKQLDEIRTAAHENIKFEIAIQRPSGSFNTVGVAVCCSVLQSVQCVVLIQYGGYCSVL